MRRFVPFLVIALLVAMVLPAAVAAKQPAGVTTAITGTTAAGAPVAGTLSITRFAVRHGQVVALGTISQVTAAGLPVAGTQAVAIPLVAATCAILHLTLGPLDLNLLGLVVHLDRVVLDISAVAGPGSLLGNLLCAVAGLLDGGLSLRLIAGLLNQILAILSGLTL